MMKFFVQALALVVAALFFLSDARADEVILPGSLAGDAGVSSSGSAQYTVPIAIPTGRAGMQPSLALGYDSNAGSSNFGLGWSLAGVSQISRTLRTSFVDGRPGGIDFDDSDDGFSTDAWSLDGARLVPAPENGYFSKLQDDQTRVQVISSSGTEPSFIAKTKAGLTIFFGSTENSKIRTRNGSVLVWAVSRIEDTFGNQIHFYYSSVNGDWGPSKIYYTTSRQDLSAAPTEAEVSSASFASVTFEYETQSSVNVSYIGGEAIERSRYVSRIESQFQGEPFRTYEFEYDETSRLGNRLLKSIVEIGANSDSAARPRLNPTTFSYTYNEPSWVEFDESYELPSGFGVFSSVENGYQFADLDGDGVDELIFSAQLGGKDKSILYRYDGSSWGAVPGLAPPVQLRDLETAAVSHAFIDLDGDSKLDLISSQSSSGVLTSSAFLQDGASWTEAPDYIVPFPILRDNSLASHVVPVTGTANADFLRYDHASGGYSYWIYDGANWTSTNLNLGTEGAQPDALYLGDFDCSGNQSLSVLSEELGRVAFYSLDLSDADNPEADLLSEIELDFSAVSRPRLSYGQCDALLTQLVDGNVTTVVTLDIETTSSVSEVRLREIADFPTSSNGSFEILVARVTSNGFDDVVVASSDVSTSEVLLFSFDQASDAWAEDDDYRYSTGDPSFAVDENYVLFGGPVGGQPLESILLLPATSGVSTAALVNKSPGFEFGTDLVPPVHFAKQDVVGSSPQFIDLNADGLVDLVGYHVDKDGKVSINEAYINTGRGWRQANDLRVPKPISNAKGGTTGQFVDVNSDGIPDYLYAYKGEFGAWTLSFVDGLPTGWREIAQYTLPVGEELSHPDYGDRGIRFFDVNVDGRVDLLIARRESDGSFVRRTFLNNGSGWVEQASTSPFLSPVPFVSRQRNDVHFETKVNQGDYYRNLGVQILDLNADGAVDLLFHYRHNPSRITSNGSVVDLPSKDGCLNEDKTITTTNPPTSVTFLHPIPVASNCAGVYYGTGVGWRNPGAGWIEDSGDWVIRDDTHLLPVPTDIQTTEENAVADFADVNGDGLVDFVPSRLVNGANLYNAHINTGRGWTPEPDYNIPNPALSQDKHQVSHRLIDLNGDGLIDIAYHRESAKGSYLNSGYGWKTTSDEFAPPERFTGAKGEDLGVRLIDVDGNGLPDALRSWRNKAGEITQTAYLNSNDIDDENRSSRTDILESVETGMGARTTFLYRSLLTQRGGDEDFYVPSPLSTFPKISYVPTMYAVEQMTVEESDGSLLHTRYRYSGFRFDAQALASLGFEERWASNYVQPDPTKSSIEGPIFTEQVRFYQDYYLSGKVREELSTRQDVVLNRRLNFYDAVPNQNSQSHRTVLIRSSAESRDLSGASVGNTNELYQYDSFNNATEVCVEFGDGSRTATFNTYDSRPELLNPQKWFLGRLTQAEIISAGPSSGISCGDLIARNVVISENNFLTRTTEFEYDIRLDLVGEVTPDSTGVLVSESLDRGHPVSLTTKYMFDRFGNRVEVKRAAPSGEERVQSAQFDELGRFPVVEINPLGHRTERTYHDLLGLPATTSDPNGLVIRNEYDGFGDLRITISPTGLVTSRSTSFETGINVFKRSVSHSTTSRVGQLPPTKTYYDNAGRALRVETAGYRGREIIQVNEYDPRGRMVRRSLPYFLDELEAFEADSANNRNPLHFVTSSFDDLNRETSVTSPDGGTSRVIYDGTTTIMVDELGRTTTKIVNLKGLVVKTIDSAGGVLQFEYGAGDRHIRTLQTDGNELVTQYDLVGNKTSTYDPDLGQWEYRYNSFGEVIWQRDAKGQTTVVEYDALGRPTRRVMPELIEQFQYDNSDMGIGKLSTVQSSHGYSEKYSYERFGRLEGKEVQIERDLFITRYVYDEYDRVVDTYHPENFRTKNVYSPSGHLSSVLANDPTGSFFDPLQLQWEAIERDQFGQVTLEKFGNGVESLTEHNDKNGSVDRIQVNLAGDNLYDLSLDYDLVGNLRSRAESTSGRSETFEYDELYRISRWDLNGNTQADYTYDQSGRILFKSDIGNYSYAGEGPSHGVKEITSVEGETWNYIYDANGNMIFGPKGHFEYYSNNSVRSIYKSDNLWSKFWYAPDGSRYRQLFSQRKQIGDMLGAHSLVETISVGAYERIRDVGGVQGVGTGGALRAASLNPFGIAPHGFSRHRLHIATDSGVVAILEANTQYDPLHGFHDQKQAHRHDAISVAKSGFHRAYVHTDELGSIVRVTDQDGKVTDAYVYDPWGKKEQISLEGMPRSRYAEGSFRRGFTGHEHLENLELIHMNGRVYDPDIARFVSADVFIQAPLVSSSYDRYSYVANNPLKFVDPTGHFLKSIGSFFKKVGDAIARPFREAGRWLKKNWREVVVTVVAVAIVVFSGGTATPLAAVMVGAAAGAASAGLYVALYGGDLSDVLFAAARGAIIGGFSAGVGHGIGSMQLGAYKSALAHGATQGAVSEANGGRFVQGFLSGSFSSLAGSQMAKSTALRNSVSAQAAASAVVGGTASTIGGGKFANGAMSGLFVVAFNHLAHRGDANSSGSRAQASGTNSLGEEVAELEFDLSVGQSAGSSKYGGIYNFSTETGNHEFSAGYGIAGFTLSSSGEMDIMFGPQLKYGGFTFGEFTMGTTVNDPYWIDFKVKARVLGIGGSVRLHETQGFYNEFKNFGPRLMNYLTNGQMRYGY